MPTILVRLLAALALLMALAAPANAHFVLNAKNRIIVVERGEAGITLYLRVPGPLLYARALSRRSDQNAPVDAPFLTAGNVGGVVVHRLDVAAIRADPAAFAAYVAAGYAVAVNGNPIAPDPGAVRIHRDVTAPPFASPAQARASLAAPSEVLASDPPFVGETVVDVALALEGVDAGGSLTLRSTLPALALPPEVAVDNHILDFRGEVARSLNVPGQLQEPVILDGSLMASISTFVLEGVRHILHGLDHVLFVLCLVAAARSLGMLMWEVTGFTLGHSVTLIAGFLGFVPAGAWFVPSVEAAIAVSIIYAATLVLRRRMPRHMVAITAGLGLLHGFGFSFVLHEILGPSAPNLLVSLISFNVGVEIGQLLVVVPAALALFLVKRIDIRLDRLVRVAAASVALVVAGFWVVERAGLVAATLAGV